VRIPFFKIFMEKNMKDKKIKRYEPVEIATTSKKRGLAMTDLVDENIWGQVLILEFMKKAMV
jgi:hypothetical protein